MIVPFEIESKFGIAGDMLPYGDFGSSLRTVTIPLDPEQQQEFLNWLGGLV